ncbi:sensor histidine kinase [Ascidiimonas sp. W6]|uniref:sensor histidine kinase n=1 Tax=Ascidiimonas meishanensis TaxID=3128903 RepID=UPI0030EBBCF1
MVNTRNAGVIANQGLVSAVKNFATNQLVIDVIDIRLDKRLGNSLKASLFRMIQELIINIIKHAVATEAFIQLTYHEERLNILVEDNGKGFDPKTTIGLHSIQRPVENLNGTLTIIALQSK